MNDGKTAFKYLYIGRWSLPGLHFPFSNKIPFEGNRSCEAVRNIFAPSLYSCLKNSELQDGGVSEKEERRNVCCNVRWWSECIVV